MMPHSGKRTQHGGNKKLLRARAARFFEAERTASTPQIAQLRARLQFRKPMQEAHHEPPKYGNYVSVVPGLVNSQEAGHLLEILRKRYAAGNKSRLSPGQLRTLIEIQRRHDRLTAIANELNMTRASLNTGKIWEAGTKPGFATARGDPSTAFPRVLFKGDAPRHRKISGASYRYTLKIPGFSKIPFFGNLLNWTTALPANIFTYGKRRKGIENELRANSARLEQDLLKAQESLRAKVRQVKDLGRLVKAYQRDVNDFLVEPSRKASWVARIQEPYAGVVGLKYQPKGKKAA